MLFQILQKELLKHKEIQERIAENINKVLSMKSCARGEDKQHDNSDEVNKTLLAELDSTVKSVVEKTEADPMFEEFFKELFPIGETDTNTNDEPPDSSSGWNQESNDQFYAAQ